MRRLTGRFGTTFRKLAGSPVFTVVSVVTLALAIGANTAIFSVVNSVLIKPLPFDEPERLVGVWHTAPGLGFDDVPQSPALHFSLVDHNRVFEDVGMWDDTRVSVTGIDEPEQVDAMLVTDRVLPMLRVPPHIGRTFTAEDDSPDSPQTVILGYGYWVRRFGADPNIVGQTLQIEGVAREIIGVTPVHLRFLGFDPAVYLPFRFDRSEVFFGNFSYQGIARLRPGVTIEEANAEVARTYPLAAEAFPMPPGLTYEMIKEARFGPNVHPLKEDVVGDVGNVLWVLLGTVGLVLLIACANVANLFLVRAETGEREFAVRTALGASRGRIATQCLTESVVLGIAGGLVGIGLALAGLRLLIYLAPENLPRLDEIGLDATVLLFTLGVSILAGLLFGLFPVLRYSTPHLVSALKEGGRGSSDGRERHRLRNLLAVSQVALSLVLLIGSGLMVRSFQALRDVHPGFERPDEVLTVRVSIPSPEMEDQDAIVRAHEEIFNRLSGIPGVTSVGGSSSITMDRYSSNDPIFVEEFPLPENQIPPIRRYKWITENYFSTMGNPVLAGRAITWDDIHNRRKVLVITDNLAREYWDDPGQAIGKRVRETTTAPWREIVGVVGNVRDDGVSQDPTPTVFWPIVVDEWWGEDSRVQRSMAYAIRTSRPNPEGLLPEVRQAIWSVNANLPLAGVRTLDELLDRSMARTSFTLVMLGIAAVAAVILGTVGIYGVISYAVSQRTREIGVRMALGARHADVNRMVLRQGGLFAAIGVAAGLAAAIGLTRLMSSLLYGVSAVDTPTYALAAIGVGAVSLLASYVPARRAAATDPVEALRWE
jgi:predicted permease